MIKVYCMTFPNLKKYIGITSNFKQRLSQHRCAYKGTRRGSLVHRAIAKYGESSINIKILGVFENWNDALEFEKQMIKEHESIEFGYNLTEGGEGTLGLRGKIPWNKGKTFSESVKKQISVSLGSRPVNVFKNGKLIGIWTNLNECSQQLKVHRSNINHCLNGKLKTTGGYSFEYK